MKTLGKEYLKDAGAYPSPWWAVGFILEESSSPHSASMERQTTSHIESLTK